MTRYIQMLLGYLLGLDIILIFMFFPSALSAKSVSMQSIAGCYYELIYLKDSDGEPKPVYRTLELIALGNDQYKFSITVIGADFHQCTGEGIAVVKKKGNNPVLEMLPDREQRNQEARYKLQPCRLKIRFSKNRIVVEDKNGACHKYFICSDRISYGDVNYNRDDKFPVCPE